MNPLGKLKIFNEQKIYKYLNIDKNRMFPSDPTGSLDDFYSMGCKWKKL